MTRRKKKGRGRTLSQKQAAEDAAAAKAAIAKATRKQKGKPRKLSEGKVNKGKKSQRGPQTRGKGRQSKPQSNRQSARSSRGPRQSGTRQSRQERESTLSEITRSPEEPVLFVGNIPHDVNRNMIIKTFTKYADDGKIRACKMPTAYMAHLGMRHHRGFAFIVFKNQVDLACVLDLYKTDKVFVEGFEDQPLECKPANQETDMPAVERKRSIEERAKSQQDQLFVGALPWTANEQDIREFCEPHGEIEQLFMPRWPTNKDGQQKHKGYAFVRFTPKTFKKAAKLAEAKESYLPRFPNIPIKINVAKGTEPNMPRSSASFKEKMKHVYNPYNHPAGHLYPSALPLDVYKQCYGTKPAPSLYDPRFSTASLKLKRIST